MASRLSLRPGRLPDGVRDVVVPALLRLSAFVTLAGGGLLVARITGLTAAYRAPWYLVAASTMLAVGLFASTSGIDLRAARENLRVVVLAVTIGVLLKAVLIGGLMYLAFHREPRYLVVGVAVAQIDPLSFAAGRLQSRMSAQAKAVLSAWASFDDPITILLTAYVSAFALNLLGSGTGRPSGTDGLVDFGRSILASLLFSGLGYILFRLLRGSPSRQTADRPAGDGAAGRLRTIAHLVVLAALAALAVWQFLMLGLAIVGLFYRLPVLDTVLRRLTQAAFGLATFALGLVLIGGVDLVAGVLLGVTAFGAQALVATVVAARLSRPDRIDILLGQQNGITAIILALLLEPTFSGTVAIIAPAIVTVNLLHAAANGARELLRRQANGTDGVVGPVPGLLPGATRAPRVPGATPPPRQPPGRPTARPTGTGSEPDRPGPPPERPAGRTGPGPAGSLQAAYVTRPLR